MVNVFKTDVPSADIAEKIKHDLLLIYPCLMVTF